MTIEEAMLKTMLDSGVGLQLALKRINAAKTTHPYIKWDDSIGGYSTTTLSAIYDMVLKVDDNV